jgi:hypothetical protein
MPREIFLDCSIEKEVRWCYIQTTGRILYSSRLHTCQILLNPSVLWIRALSKWSILFPSWDFLPCGEHNSSKPRSTHSINNLLFIFCPFGRMTMSQSPIRLKKLWTQVPPENVTVSQFHHRYPKTPPRSFDDQRRKTATTRHLWQQNEIWSVRVLLALGALLTPIQHRPNFEYVLTCTTPIENALTSCSRLHSSTQCTQSRTFDEE